MADNAAGNTFSSEREGLGTAPRTIREFCFYLILTAACSTIWLWPHFIHFRQVPDRGDPVFSAWRLARFARQLAVDPLHLLDGNIFHPLPLTLTYSDPTILQGLLSSPVLWVGVEPLVVSNLMFFVAFPACGLAFFFAGWRLTGDPRAAFVTGILGAWYPFHGEHYSHLELQWFMFVPLAIVALIKVLVKPSLHAGVALGAAVAAQWLASMYIGTMLMTFLVPLAVILLIGWRVRPSMELARAIAAAIAITVSVCLLTGIPFMKSRHARGDRTRQDIVKWSALPEDYIATHRRMATYAWHPRAQNHPERELFPGTAPLAFAVGGVLSLEAVPVALALSGALAFDWSLGTNGLLYETLYDWILPYRSMRVPARFSVLVGSSLILLSCLGVASFLRRCPGRFQTGLAFFLAVAALWDLRLSTTLVNYWPTAPGIYRHVSPHMVLAELPVGHEIDYMYFSTQHWATLIGGYSGFIPADPALTKTLADFPSRSAMASLRDRGATHITYNCSFERSESRCRYTLQQLDTDPLLSQVSGVRWNGADVRLYQFR